jgi:hypothetical protein
MLEPGLLARGRFVAIVVLVRFLLEVLVEA